MTKFWIIISSTFGFFSVAMGAFGAHILKDNFSGYSLSIWNTAVLYMMFHTLAILAVAILGYIKNSSQFNTAGWSFSIGTILFSGSLFTLALTGIKTLGAITPIGGFCFLFGWIWLIYSAIKV